MTFPAYLAAEASLRTLAEARNLDLDDLIEASENNTIKELLEDKESDQEPSETHSQGLHSVFVYPLTERTSSQPFIHQSNPGEYFYVTSRHQKAFEERQQAILFTRTR